MFNNLFVSCFFFFIMKVLIDEMECVEDEDDDTYDRTVHHTPSILPYHRASRRMSSIGQLRSSPSCLDSEGFMDPNINIEITKTKKNMNTLSALSKPLCSPILTADAINTSQFLNTAATVLSSEGPVPGPDGPCSTSVKCLRSGEKYMLDNPGTC